MALPLPSTNPDDPNFRGKTWDQVEAALDNRDQYIMAMADVDPAYEEERGPTFTDPARPLYTTFPWEEKIEPFAKPPSCTLENWKHTCLKYSLGKHSATLQFDKGTMNNTLDPAMLDALQDAIMDLQHRSSVRVVILKSSGKLFSNGFDPKYLISETNLSEQDITAVQLQFGKILYFWQRLPQWTVALIQGSTMGAAVGLVCACDMVISVRTAFYAMSETKLGAVATTSIPYITRRIRFIRNVYQLVLAGASLSAETAKDYGIVSEVVDTEADLATKCKAICDSMTLCAPGAVAATKEVVMNTVGVPVSSFLLDYIATVAGDVRKGPEATSGIRSIQEKKKPAWAAAVIVP
mmetsp:Transcript_66248/g.141777  ORF Transcript_66248/g.141777 Transcript_66248/m.141777 type:complete len:351 (+) Transcript_66248:84-1136(+)